MRQSTQLPDPQEPVHSLSGHFPVARGPCLINANYSDYAVVANLVRRATGSFSDGLVMVKQNNAYLVDGPRPAQGNYPPGRRAFSAIVHKSYFGYEASLMLTKAGKMCTGFSSATYRPTLSWPTWYLIPPAGPAPNERVAYDVEYSFTVWGTNTKMHWRAQFPCKNALRSKRQQLEREPLHLHSAFLNTALRPDLPPNADPAERDPRESTPAVSRYLYFLLTLRVVEYRVQEASAILHSFKH